MALFRHHPKRCTEIQLPSDPRIKAFEARRELETNEAFIRLMSFGAISLIGIGVVIGIGGYVVDLGIGNELIIGGSTALAGFSFQDYMNTRRRKTEDFGELLTLSSVFYQSPATIRSFLKTERVHASIENLLQAALGEEIGHAYWQQAVDPYIAQEQRGFKQEWTYDIDLKDRPEALVIGTGADAVRLEAEDYWELHTTLKYHQSAFDPHPVFYIACGFESQNLPTWFQDANYFLREIVPLADENRSRLAALLPAPPSGTRQRSARAGKRKPPWKDRQYWEKVDDRIGLARLLFDPRLLINGSEIAPDNAWADEFGLRWSYALSKELQEEMTDTVEIEIELTTVQQKSQKYFPVYLTSPTRNPTIRFDYSDAPEVGEVQVETFFSAARPYDEQLRHSLRRYGRSEIHTRRDDWVFVGSGCIFVWS